jgi:hypothetical protein
LTKRCRIGTTGLLLLILAGCWEDTTEADDRDKGWALSAATLCPAVTNVVRNAARDGMLSVSDVEGVSGAIEVAMASPVKGQACDMKHVTPPSNRDVQVPDGLMFNGKTYTQKYKTIRSPE